MAVVHGEPPVRVHDALLPLQYNRGPADAVGCLRNIPQRRTSLVEARNRQNSAAGGAFSDYQEPLEIRESEDRVE